MLNRLKNSINNFSIRRLLYNKKFAVSFSFLSAFIFWLVIVINQNPVREQTFKDIPVTISLSNTVAEENGLNIVGDISDEKFSVTVSGPSYIVSGLKTEDFSLYASAAEITQPGEYNLEVVGSKNSAQAGYSFVSIYPSTITVKVDYFDTKAFNVIPKLIGISANEGLIAETPVVSGTENDTITISGPRAVMETIDTVAAYSEVNRTLASSETFDADIILYDKELNVISKENLTLSSTTVKVAVPISKKASVKVVPEFSSIPSGLSKKSLKYSLNYSSVNIIGPPDVVSSISEISLSAIDFSDISVNSNSFDVEAVLPDGVKILDSIEYFNVTVDTSGYIEKTFNVSKTEHANLPNGLKVNSITGVKNVTVCGPEDVISKLKASDLYAVVDLTDKSAGEYTVDAVIKSNLYDTIWQVGKYTTTVKIQ